MIQTHMATPRMPDTSTRSQSAFNVSDAQSNPSDAAHPLDFSVVSLRQHTQTSEHGVTTETPLLGDKLGEKPPQIGSSPLLATIADDDQDADSTPQSADTPLTGAAAVLAEQVSTQMNVQQNRETSGGTFEISQAQMNIPGTTQLKGDTQALTEQALTKKALTETSPHPTTTLSQTEKSALKPAALSPDFQQPLSSTSSLLSTLSSAQATSSAQPQATSPSVTASTTTGAEWASVRVDPQAGKWGEQMLSILHDRVTLQAQQHVQEAKIRLDPPELGKLDLFVRVDGDRLSVQIHTNTVATREALIQVSDRLRAELQEQNFVHVDVNVSAEHSDGHGQSTTSDENEPTIFAARVDQQTTIPTASTSEHWLSTKA